MHYSTTLLVALPFVLHASMQCYGHQVPLTPHHHPGQPPERVAVIGAGAGGSSAAFWIAKAKARYGVDIEVDVYESEGHVGGRESLFRLVRDSLVDDSSPTGSTVVYPYDNLQLRPVELGASIFVEVNKNMWRAVDEFGFERAAYKDASTVMGVWDGTQFVITVSRSDHPRRTHRAYR